MSSWPIASPVWPLLPVGPALALGRIFSHAWLTRGAGAWTLPSACAVALLLLLPRRLVLGLVLVLVLLLLCLLLPPLLLPRFGAPWWS